MSKKLFLCFYFLLFTLILVGGFTSLAPKAHAQAINVATKTDVTPGTQFATYKGIPVYRLHVANTGERRELRNCQGIAVGCLARKCQLPAARIESATVSAIVHRSKRQDQGTEWAHLNKVDEWEVVLCSLRIAGT